MTFILGFVAQALFFARTLLQWILSERARMVLSPTIFWVLSIIASYLFFIYGWLRDDFSILLGQIISYYIYIWNLNEKGAWHKLSGVIRMALVATPLVAVAFVLKDGNLFVENFLKNRSIPLWLVVFGSLGQVIFTFRFVYQWIYSMRRKESILPLGFWVISLVGSGIIVVYGMIRIDPVLVLGQSVGFIAYSRNIIIHQKQLKNA